MGFFERVLCAGLPCGLLAALEMMSAMSSSTGLALGVFCVLFGFLGRLLRACLPWLIDQVELGRDVAGPASFLWLGRRWGPALVGLHLVPAVVELRPVPGILVVFNASCS